MPSNPLSDRVETLEQQLQVIQARTNQRRVSPLFTLAIGGLLGAVVALLAVPGAKTNTSAGTVTSASGDLGPGGGTGGNGSGGSGANTDGGSAGASSYATSSGTGSPSGVASAADASGSAGASGGSSGGTVAGSKSGTNNGGIRGVTPTSVKVGIFCIDTTVFKSTYPNYYTGPCADYINAQLAYLHRTGQDVIAGRKVEYVVRTIPVQDAASPQSICDQWAQQDKLFAVAGDYVGFGCFAQQYHGPTINWSGTTATSASAVNSYGPYYFQVGPVLDQVYRNLVAWGAAKGYFSGKRIGIHYPNSSPPGLVTEDLVNALHKAGYPSCSSPVATGCIAATTTYNVAQGDLTGNSSQPDDEVAVQKFIGAKVDLALLLGGTEVVSPFTHDAQAQGYHPKYLGFDDTEMTTDTVSQYFEPSEYDGTPAITFYQYGERNAGIVPSPAQALCINNYDRYAHVTLDYKQESVATSDPNHKPEAQFYHILLANCDDVAALQAGLQGAGHHLTPDTFRAALEHLGTVAADRISGFGWTPNRHWGGTTVREMVWHRQCLCYMDVTAPRSPYSP